MTRRGEADAADPHADAPILTAGEPLSDARAAMILVHGRGAGAADILGLAAELDRGGFAYLAPEAAGRTWYPRSFLSPLEENEPHLSSALGVVRRLIERLEREGHPSDRVILVGFSQGACLSLEFAARRARRYGGVAGLSGGLIGPPGAPRACDGSLEGTPVFLGCSDADPHVPLARVLESAEVLRRLGGDVTERIYPGLGHTVNRDELDRVRRMMDALAPPG
jgi:predicted esterase